MDNGKVNVAEMSKGNQFGLNGFSQKRRPNWGNPVHEAPRSSPTKKDTNDNGKIDAADLASIENILANADLPGRITERHKQAMARTRQLQLDSGRDQQYHPQARLGIRQQGIQHREGVPRAHDRRPDYGPHRDNEHVHGRDSYSREYGYGRDDRGCDSRPQPYGHHRDEGYDRHRSSRPQDRGHHRDNGYSTYGISRGHQQAERGLREDTQYSRGRDHHRGDSYRPTRRSGTRSRSPAIRSRPHKAHKYTDVIKFKSKPIDRDVTKSPRVTVPEIASSNKRRRAAEPLENKAQQFGSSKDGSTDEVDVEDNIKAASPKRRRMTTRKPVPASTPFAESLVEDEETKAPLPKRRRVNTRRLRPVIAPLAEFFDEDEEVSDLPVPAPVDEAEPKSSTPPQKLDSPSDEDEDLLLCRRLAASRPGLAVPVKTSKTLWENENDYIENDMPKRKNKRISTTQRVKADCSPAGRDDLRACVHLL
jgi:hypothetical protein